MVNRYQKLGLRIVAVALNIFPLEKSPATVKIPLTPFNKGGTQTPLKSHKLTNHENDAAWCMKFSPLKKGGRGDFDHGSSGGNFSNWLTDEKR